MWLNPKCTMRFLPSFKGTLTEGNQWAQHFHHRVIVFLTFKHFTILFSQKHGIENSSKQYTKKMEDVCAFKGWHGPQLFPDWLFLVRNLALRAFQSFTLSVHVKMKWSLFLTMPHLTIASSKPLAVDKAWGHVTLCKWPSA